ncbi:hypothetical protein HG531_006481 [Fusarium graminearum]|nr:hypothetical protein HG531_006481 [Fusarium graminearum]
MFSRWISLSGTLGASFARSGVPDGKLCIDRLSFDLNILLLYYLIHENPNIALLQRAETESCASTQKSRAELVGVVGNDAESSVGCVLFHNSSQSHLSGTCHGISLVKYDELESSHPIARTGGATQREDLLGAGKRLDLLSHNVNATVVRGVELENHLAHVGSTIDTTGKGENC